MVKHDMIKAVIGYSWCTLFGRGNGVDFVLDRDDQAIGGFSSGKRSLQLAQNVGCVLVFGT